MSAEIATLEKVGLAADELRRQGKKVTANSVIAAIGGGSKPTVLKHLKALRTQTDDQDEEIPASVYDLVGRFSLRSMPKGSRRKKRASTSGPNGSIG